MSPVTTQDYTPRTSCFFPSPSRLEIMGKIDAYVRKNGDENPFAMQGAGGTTWTDVVVLQEPPLSPFTRIFKLWHVDLGNSPFMYQKHTNDFGIVVKKLFVSCCENESTKKDQNIDSSSQEAVLFQQQARSYRLLLKNIVTIATKEKFAVFSAKEDEFYYSRDVFCLAGKGKFGVSLPYDLDIPFKRLLSRKIIFEHDAFFLAKHVFFGRMIGQAAYSIARCTPDMVQFGSEQCSITSLYIEGGNCYLASNKQGIQYVFVGCDLLYINLHLLRIHKKFEQLGIDKRPLPPLTREETRSVLKEMYAQGLVKTKKCQKGTLQDDQLLALRINTDDYSIQELLQHAQSKGIYDLFDLSNQEIDDSKGLAQKYLIQKEIIQELLGRHFGVSRDNVIFIPQCDYHIDCFLKPGPSGSFFIQDYDLCVDVLRKMLTLDLTLGDRIIVLRYIAAMERLAERLSGLFEDTRKRLEQAGFTLIPMPAVFYDLPGNREGDSINYINAVSGYSPETNAYYYIVLGTQLGDRLGQIFMNMFKEFLSSYVPGVHLYYVGYDSKNPTDFSSAMVWTKLHSCNGVHCLTMEMSTESHREEKKD